MAAIARFQALMPCFQARFVRFRVTFASFRVSFGRFRAVSCRFWSLFVSFSAKAGPTVAIRGLLRRLRDASG
jgi:hypothetical protein